MGLAASQSRLLLLTARKDDIEKQLMMYANKKLTLSRDSMRISREYSDAMNKQSLVWTSDYGTDVGLTYDLVMRPSDLNMQNQYVLTNTSNGRVMLDEDYISALGISSCGNPGEIQRIGRENFLAAVMDVNISVASAYISYRSQGVVSSADENYNGLSDLEEANYYLNLYDAICEAGWESNEGISSEGYLQNQMQNGNITLWHLNEYYEWESVSSGSADCPYSEETNESDEAEAEAEYDAEKDKIDYLEQQIDLKMKNLDTERSAVDTEIDSVKKLIDKNIERAFKMFQA